MKFRVIGHRKSDAHRVTLEFEAESKAAAERSALKQGLEVVRVELVQAGTDAAGKAAEQPAVGRVRAERPSGAQSAGGGGGVSRFLIALLILVAAAGAAYYFWEPIRQHIPGLH